MYLRMVSLQGGIIAEQSQGIPDAFGAPQRIFSAQLTNRIPHLLRYGWPATPPSRLPTPVETKRSSVPSLDRCRPHEMSHLMPWIPHPGEQRPQQPEGLGESGSWLILLRYPTFTHGKLAFCGQYWCHQSRPWSKKSPQTREEISCSFLECRNCPEDGPKKAMTDAHGQQDTKL